MPTYQQLGPIIFAQMTTDERDADWPTPPPNLVIHNVTTGYIQVYDLMAEAWVDVAWATDAPTAHAASHTDATDDIQDATAGQKGVATAAQITKLDGITALADVTGDNAPQAHTVASHSDTTATGAELNTLVGGGDADALHDHAMLITNAEAIAAVEGEATLDLTGDVTIADGKGISLQEAITFTGATAENIISFPDNLALALTFRQGANAYMRFQTTDDVELVHFYKKVALGTNELGGSDGLVRLALGATNTITGNLDVTGALGVTGAATLSSTLDVAGNSAFGPDASVNAAIVVGVADHSTITASKTMAYNDLGWTVGADSLLLIGATYTGNVTGTGYTGLGFLGLAFGATITGGTWDGASAITFVRSAGQVSATAGTVNFFHATKGTPWAPTSGSVYGFRCDNIGNASFTNVVGLYIAAQTEAGTNTFGIYQPTVSTASGAPAGTAHQNRLAGYTTIGRDTTPLTSAVLYVSQPITTAARPTVRLDQYDQDQAYIYFVGYAAAGVLTNSLVDEGDQASETRQGWVKIQLVDLGNQITDTSYYVPFYSLSA